MNTTNVFIKDPVCQMTIDMRNAAAVADYNGVAYYFCSEKCKKAFEAQPNIYINKGVGMRLTVGVMGSADPQQTEQTIRIARLLGRAIAQHGYVLITGACPGLPYECARESKEANGFSIGISPASSLDEHVHKFHSPSDVYDALIYTGNGLMGREVVNIHSSDMVIILGGQSGTLGEFAIAYDEGKLIGVVSGIDGISELIPNIVSSFKKDTGAKIYYESDPIKLVESLSNYYLKHHYKHPSCFCDEYSN